jgi:hypothetical protein
MIKQDIDEYLIERYSFLQQVVFNLTKTNNQRFKSAQEDILNDCICALYTNINQLPRFKNIEAYAVSWLNNQIKFKDTRTEAQYLSRSGTDVIPEKQYVESYFETDEEKDLIFKYGYDKAEKITQINSIYPFLTRPEQILFNYLYVDLRTVVSVAKELKLSRTTLQEMVKNLKIKIKNLLNTHYGRTDF